MGKARSWAVLCAAVCVVMASGCEEETTFDPRNPASGPGQMVGNGEPVTSGLFVGGEDDLPEARPVEALPQVSQPDCGADCRAYCDGLSLENPVNQGLCGSLWGVGLSHRPIRALEACRRLHVDMLGRMPTRAEILDRCGERPWGNVVRDLMATPEFVLVNQRRWADRLLYNNQVVSIERIYDADDLVGKLYRGLVPYDLFAAVVSAHPVLTRRLATPGDRAEFLFRLFLGRPPLGSERSDVGRLYTLWVHDYYDHPALQQRLPDAFVELRCIDGETGAVSEATRGECTSVTFGFHELILTPDVRVRAGERLWSGALTAEEWTRLQLPGRLVAQQPRFWETLVDDVLMQYLGYDLGTQVPEVREALVRYALNNNGDIRAVHFAVATSVAYLQTALGSSPTDHQWAHGPLKQIEVEPWLDTVKQTTGYALSRCDHRMTRPGDFLGDQTTLAGLALVESSRWELDEERRVVGDYRELARVLGGCPVNDVGGRFKTISILTTAAQTHFVSEVCNPGMAMDGDRVLGASSIVLLPKDMNPATAVTPQIAEDILRVQTRRFLGRSPGEDEIARAVEASERCALCRAEEFARPVCYALLSSSEMLFY